MAKKKSNRRNRRPPVRHLYVSLKAFCELHGDDPANVKLELDFSPPFEMLSTKFTEQGPNGFNSQTPPSYYNIADLQRLFLYITQTLPAAITLIAKNKPVRNKERVTLAMAGHPQEDHKDLLEAIIQEKNPSADWKKVKDLVEGTLQDLQLSRIHVDPHKNNSLVVGQSTSGNDGPVGGDVPPPKMA